MGSHAGLVFRCAQFGPALAGRAAAAAAPAATETDLRALKPPIEIPSYWHWAAWVLAVVLAAALGWWLVRFWKQRHAGKPAAIIVVPPHVRARDKLRQALQWIHEPRLFCIAVSDALRIYLEERFRLRAPERTTEEFLDELQTSPLLSHQQKQRLGEFLTQCDLAKFARYEPTETELRELLEAALRLVDETVAVFEPRPGEAAAAEPAATKP